MLRVCFVHRLIEVLQEMARSDWQLATMVCKTLWNYSGKITSSDACFGNGAAVSALVDILTELLGEYISVLLSVKCFDIAHWAHRRPQC